MTVTHDFEESDSFKNWTKELEEKEQPQRDLTCELGDECENCGS